MQYVMGNRRKKAENFNYPRLDREKKNIFVFIKGEQIGGTERRFGELINYWIINGIVNPILIVNKALYEDYKTNDIINRIEQISIVLDNERLLKLIPKVFNIIRFYLNRSTKLLLHMPLEIVPFLRLRFGKKVSLVCSITSSSFHYRTISEVKVSVSHLLKILEGDIVDVLSPEVYRILKKIPYFSRKLYLTPGTFVSYRPNELNWYEKYSRNVITFLGRSTKFDYKNLVKFLDCVFFVGKSLQKNGVRYKFNVITYGYSDRLVEERICYVNYDPKA